MEEKPMRMKKPILICLMLIMSSTVFVFANSNWTYTACPTHGSGIKMTDVSSTQHRYHCPTAGCTWFRLESHNFKTIPGEGVQQCNICYRLRYF